MKMILFILLAFFNRAPTYVANADTITGKWMSTEKNLLVEVFKTGNEYKAKVLWFDDVDNKKRPVDIRQDTENPDKNLRNRKIIGLQVMHGLYYNTKDNEWQGGKIYDPTTGREWSAKAWINKEGVLKVRGFWHFTIFGKNMSFKKV